MCRSVKVCNTSTVTNNAEVGHKCCSSNNGGRPIPRRGMIKLRIATCALHSLVHVLKMIHD